MDWLFPNPLELLSNLAAAVSAAVGSDSGMDLAIKAVVAYLIAVWAAFVIWVVRDITNRSESLIIQTFSILLVVAFTPIFGLPIYLLIRPRSTIFERYYEEVGLAENGARVCDRCEREVGDAYRYCPFCRNELLSACPECGELIERDWEHCAFCGTNVEEAKKRRRDEPYRKSAVKKPSKPTTEKVIVAEIETAESKSGPEVESPRVDPLSQVELPESESRSKAPNPPSVTVGDVPEVTIPKK